MYFFYYSQVYYKNELCKLTRYQQIKWIKSKQRNDKIQELTEVT